VQYCTLLLNPGLSFCGPYRVCEDAIRYERGVPCRLHREAKPPASAAGRARRSPSTSQIPNPLTSDVGQAIATRMIPMWLPHGRMPSFLGSPSS
jgi:hypothetical protein